MSELTDALREARDMLREVAQALPPETVQVQEQEFEPSFLVQEEVAWKEDHLPGWSNEIHWNDPMPERVITIQWPTELKSPNGFWPLRPEDPEQIQVQVHTRDGKRWVARWVEEGDK